MTPAPHTTLHPYAAAPHGPAPARLVRAVVRRSSAVRAIVKSEPVQHQIRTWRALSVVGGSRTRFLSRQLAGGRTEGYALRRSGLTFHVRHGTGDVAILNKIFARERGANTYEPPAAVAAALAATRAPRILDVGANIGLFGLFALDRWPGARITAFEPEPDNLRVLRRTVEANATGGRWRVVAAAASDAPGELRFVPGLRAEARIARAGDDGTISVPAVDLFEYLTGRVDLVKMDMEGGEWPILSDPRLAEADIGAIRLEWHDTHCPAPDPRTAAIERLRAAGFASIVDVPGDDGLHGVIWAWR